MMSAAIVLKAIEDYVGSDLWRSDVLASGNDILDVSHRIGLCSGCCAIYGTNDCIDIFNVRFPIKDGVIVEEVSNNTGKVKYNQLVFVIESWEKTIKQIKQIINSEEYKKLVEKKRGYLQFQRFPIAMSSEDEKYLELDYNKSLVDVLLCVGAYSSDMIMDKIKRINNIDDEIFEVGRVFCDSLPSPIHGRFFRLYKDPGTGQYCIKFDYSMQLGIDEIDPQIAILFNKKNKLYTRSSKELEVMIGLVK